MSWFLSEQRDKDTAKQRFAQADGDVAAISNRAFAATDAIGNRDFCTVWTAVALILFNLDRFSAQPLLDPWWFLGLAVGLPMLVMGAAYQWQRRRAKPEAKESLQQRDIVSETEEVEVG